MACCIEAQLKKLDPHKKEGERVYRHQHLDKISLYCWQLAKIRHFPAGFQGFLRSEDARIMASGYDIGLSLRQTDLTAPKRVTAFQIRSK